MTQSTQEQKRERARAFPAPTGAAPASGRLQVTWESPFDRMCFLLATPELAIKNNRRYVKLLAELTAGSGCTEEELLAHGNKVRAYLFFAQDRLTKAGEIDKLAGKEKYAYQLPPVIPAF